jgi:hypothetical protein
MIKRLTAQPYFQTFDGADPNACTSNRDQSVTALQALYFVNDEFLHEQARRFAERLLGEEDNDQERLRGAFTTVLCRPPTSDETALLQEHLAAVRAHAASDADAELQAWSSLTRSLLRLNEFLYVD